MLHDVQLSYVTKFQDNLSKHMDFIQNWPLRQSTVPSLDCDLTMLCHKNYRIKKKVLSRGVSSLLKLIGGLLY